jgi:DNA-binding FadR family transcriptional regulator
VEIPKASELIATQIRRKIILGEIAEGDFLPDDAQLMADFHVSRPTLREALRILESERLISTRRGARGGTEVHAPHVSVAARYVASVLEWSGATVDDVYAARQLVEPFAVRIGTLRRPADALSRLKSALDVERSVADDPNKFPVAAAQFHRRVVELSGNMTLSLLAAVVHEITASVHAAAVAQLTRGTAATRNSGLAPHESLVRLIEAGDADGAEKLWSAHMQKAGAILKRGVAGKRIFDLMD